VEHGLVVGDTGERLTATDQRRVQNVQNDIALIAGFAALVAACSHWHTAVQCRFAEATPPLPPSLQDTTSQGRARCPAMPTACMWPQGCAARASDDSLQQRSSESVAPYSVPPLSTPHESSATQLLLA
jgi:hypothetical protein